MPHHFDPRAMLKQSAIPLLRQFFQMRRELEDLPWDELKENRQFDLVYHAWQGLPETQRHQVQTIFQEIWECADERAIQAIAEELRVVAPQRLWEFASCQSRLNKVLWARTNFPEVFEKGTLFARADSLSSSRYAIRRNSFPKRAITITPEICAAFAAALRDYYWANEMRGRHCRVEHYTRSGGNEYFFAYLDNWPDSHLICEEGGQFESVSQRDAFSLLFVFCPQDGSLELVAKGSSAVHYHLQQAFAQAVFGIEVAPADPLRPEYLLDQVLDSDFTYPTELNDRIATVRLSRILLKPAPSTLCPATLEIKFTSKIARRQWLELIHRQIGALGLQPHQVHVRQASFQLKFINQGFGRTKTMTFTVNLPSSCDLKTKPDELREIGVRCLQRWGILA